MTNKALSGPDEVDAGWLTTVLCEAGAIAHGEVIHVEHRKLDGNWSSNAYLTLRYSHDAKGECPQELFIKNSSGFGPSEVHYYTRDYVDVDAAPLPRCFHAAYDENRQHYHLLLEDVSATHELMLHQSANMEYAYALADAFGAMHARWWGAERFGQIGETMPSAHSIHQFVSEAQPGIAHLRQHYRNEIGATRLDMISRFFDEHPRTLVERLAVECGFSVIHGDANPTNVFVPRTGPGAPIYLIDRQPFESSLTVFLGVYDITHATTHRWDTKDRRQLEVAMLRRYHDRLIEHGVDDYSWSQLIDDYVLCAGMGIYDAVERCAQGPNEELKWLWLPMLQKSHQALVDHQDQSRFFA